MVREQLSRPFIILALSISLIGVTCLAATLVIAPPSLTVQLLLLLPAVVLAEAFTLRLHSFSVSLTYPLVLAAIPMGGPAAAGMVAALSFASLQDLRERPALAVAFNFGQIVISGTAAGWAYVGLNGPMLALGNPVPLDSRTAPAALGALLISAVVFNVLNMLLISLAVQLGRGVPFARVLRDLAGYAPTQFALVFVGLLMAQVLSIQPVAFPLFLFPLFLARQVYHSYSTMRDAYLDMVRSLVGALEAKDPYTRGHSERVAGYAKTLAARLGSDDRTVETVEQAALLHDIGKLSLPMDVLTKASGLSESEFVAVRRHPWFGGQMVRRIPALRHLGDAVKAHHERIDGSGYPIGMRGDEIPHIARILAVADAYDAMTTHRAYRPAMTPRQAIRELQLGAGTQFDQVLVDCFIEAGVDQVVPPAPPQSVKSTETLAS